MLFEGAGIQESFGLLQPPVEGFHHLPAQEVAVHQGLEVRRTATVFPHLQGTARKVARITQGFFQVFRFSSGYP